MKNIKEARSALKGIKGLQREFEKERARLRGSMKSMRKMARTGTIPDWSGDVFSLYRNGDYSYFKLLKLMRKNKLL